MGQIRKNKSCKIACHDYRQVSCSIALSKCTALASRWWRNDSTTQVLIIPWHSFLIPEMENFGRRGPVPNIKLTGYVFTLSYYTTLCLLHKITSDFPKGKWWAIVTPTMATKVSPMLTPLRFWILMCFKQ